MKKTLTLAKAWTYRSPTMTVPFPAGTHEVKPDIYAQALTDGAITEEMNDGGSSGKPGPGSGTDSAEK